MYTEKLNAINTDPNQHSSRKTRYQDQTLKKQIDLDNEANGTVKYHLKKKPIYTQIRKNSNSDDHQN